MGGLGGLGGMGGFGNPAGAGANAGAGVQAGVGANAGAGAGAGNPYAGLDINSLIQNLGAGGAGFGGAGLGAGGVPPNLAAFMPPQQPVNANLPPAERYKDQLLQMKEMGFTNQELNIQMLDATGGNVQLAIERLLGMMG